MKDGDTSDDWKGEALIRAKPTKEQQRAEKNRLVNVIHHNARRAEGAPLPAAKSHQRMWFK